LCGERIVVREPLFAADVAFGGVQLIADGVTNVPFMDLPQPRRELGRVVSVKFGDLLVDGETRLLDQV
jgi:hypothetical protein